MQRKTKRVMKRHAGRTPIARTPFRIRATGMELTSAVEERTRQVLRRRLARFGTLIERVDVRFKDVNGPRGGRDTVARIHLLVAGRPPVFVEERALAAGPAIALAAAAVGEAMDRATSKRRSKRKMTAPAPTHAPEIPSGRAHAAVRHGREPERKEAEPPRARPRRRGMVYELEESATKPSRKSTRKSANRMKGASRLSRRTRRRKHAPRSRASRAQRQRQRSRT